MSSVLREIGEYQILEKLGRGGMADVYLALDRKNDRRVALKLVEHGSGEEARAVLEAERLGAFLQQRLSDMDPRAPKIHSFGDLDGYFYIDMEFVEGNDLSTLIRSHSLSPSLAAKIAIEICGMLRSAHALCLQIDGREFRAIVHGDIKPRNIRIGPDGAVRVLDFGISKGLSITRRLTSNLFGSAAYSSPERLETGRIDEMSDLWSVGVVLYEMLEGTLPFEASSTDRLETIIRARPSPRLLGASCPSELKAIVVKALAGSPARRYQTAAEFESDLAAFLSGKSTLASQEDEETRRAFPAEAEETRRTTPSAPERESQPPSRRRISPRTKWVVIGVLAVAGIVGLLEGAAGRAAANLRHELIPGQMEGDKAWDRYQQIRRLSPLKIAPLMLRAPLETLLLDGCETIANEYNSSDSPRVREGDWVRCRRYMSYVAQFDPANSKASAMSEYANGHILRINRKSLDAVAAFQRAASLQPKWPDPYLGLARTYIYNLTDIERGTQALKRVEELGHTFGKRELAMLADAYKARGERDWDNAVRLRDTEKEEDFLKKAKEDLNEALKRYSQIAPWGDSTNKILDIEDSLSQVQNRLDELNPPNPLLPWNWFKN